MITYETSKYIRISKAEAKKKYENGDSVLFIPCKLNPENSWGLGIEENKYLWGQCDSFEKLCNEYTFYNCNSETGTYIAFYTRR